MGGCPFDYRGAALRIAFKLKSAVFTTTAVGGLVLHVHQVNRFGSGGLPESLYCCAFIGSNDAAQAANVSNVFVIIRVLN